MSRKTVSVVALLAAGAGLYCGAGVAQAPAPFTAAQAEAGRAAYAANCMSCHQANLGGEGDALPLAGQTFIAAWGKRTTADLYNTIRTSMPYGKPGSLDAETYAEPGRLHPAVQRRQARRDRVHARNGGERSPPSLPAAYLPTSSGASSQLLRRVPPAAATIPITAVRRPAPIMAPA